MATNTNEAYVGIINKLFDGQMQDNTPQNITPEVVQLINTMTDEIVKCSRAYLGTHIVYMTFYTATSIDDILIAYGGGQAVDWLDTNPPYTNNPMKTFIDWIDVLMGNRQYKSCVTIAKAKYLSPVQLALYGL